MAKKDKPIVELMSGIIDFDIPFKDLCKILETVGFQKRIKGDHHIFYKDGIEEIINIQPAHSKAKAYQVRQIRKLFQKYNLGGKRSV